MRALECIGSGLSECVFVDDAIRHGSLNFSSLAPLATAYQRLVAAHCITLSLARNTTQSGCKTDLPRLACGYVGKTRLPRVRIPTRVGSLLPCREDRIISLRGDPTYCSDSERASPVSRDLVRYVFWGSRARPAQKRPRDATSRLKRI